jgi:apolipoprotein N-acyltransferase
MKFNEDHVLQSLALYREMITEAPADLIATPETAVPLLSTQLPKNYLENLDHFARQNDSTLLVGIPWSPGPGIYLNSLIGFSFAQATPYRYDKHHLVPFGEFIPPGARWFVDMMRIPLGDFGRGDLYQAPIGVRDQWVLPNICYEDLFGEDLAVRFKDVANAPTLFVNISNIGWFGNTPVVEQHIDIARMRSKEFNRTTIRATNTGGTAIISSEGEVVAKLQPYVRGHLMGNLPASSKEITAFAYWAGHWGLMPLWMITAVIMLMTLLFKRFRHRGESVK